jgi:hypothetical protein
MIEIPHHNIRNNILRSYLPIRNSHNFSYRQIYRYRLLQSIHHSTNQQTSRFLYLLSSNLVSLPNLSNHKTQTFFTILPLYLRSIRRTINIHRFNLSKRFNYSLCNNSPSLLNTLSLNNNPNANIPQTLFNQTQSLSIYNLYHNSNILYLVDRTTRLFKHTRISKFLTSMSTLLPRR